MATGQGNPGYVPTWIYWVLGGALKPDEEHEREHDRRASGDDVPEDRRHREPGGEHERIDRDDPLELRLRCVQIA